LPFKIYLVNGKNKIFLETEVKNFNFITILKKNIFLIRSSFRGSGKINMSTKAPKPIISIIFGNLQPQIFTVQKG